MNDMERILACGERPPLTEDPYSVYFRINPKAQLRPEQVLALRELYTQGGAFCPMLMGSGKTLVTMLAPSLVGAQRPVLVIPALQEKTRKEFLEYRKQWAVTLPTLLTYNALGHPTHERDLERLRPDLLILDEAHRVKNEAAAVTRRIDRYISEHRPRVIALSGTLLTHQLQDWAHIMRWCLGARAPVPWGKPATERLSNELTKLWPDIAPLPHDYFGFVRSRAGVVPTLGSPCDQPLRIGQWQPSLPTEVERLIEQVLVTGMRPDGELLEELEVPDCIAQLSLGFWYRWEPAPPRWWLEPRRRYNRLVRDVLETFTPGLDSPSQVAAAIDAARIAGTAERQAWLAVKDRYTPTTVPVWVDDSVLRGAAQYEGLIWVGYRAAGERLHELGVPYFGGATNPEPYRGPRAALSITAHGTGRNLQHWHRSLVLSLPGSALRCEQLIGRTHRAGQSRPVDVDMYTSTEYHQRTLARIAQEAQNLAEASGTESKLWKR